MSKSQQSKAFLKSKNVSSVNSSLDLLRFYIYINFSVRIYF